MNSTYGYSTSFFIITVQSATGSANDMTALHMLLSMVSLQPSMITRYGVFNTTQMTDCFGVLLSTAVLHHGEAFSPQTTCCTFLTITYIIYMY